MDRAVSKVQKLKSRRKYSLPSSPLVFSPPASLVEISSPTNEEVDSESGDNISADINVTCKDNFEHKQDVHFHAKHYTTSHNTNVNNKSKAVW